MSRVMSHIRMSHTCDMPHPYVWHDSSIFVTWLLHMCNSVNRACGWVMAHIWMRHVTHADFKHLHHTHGYVRHDLFIHVRHDSFMSVWHDSSTFAACPIHHLARMSNTFDMKYPRDMCNSNVTHVNESCGICVTWLIHTFAIWLIHVSHDSFMRDLPHSLWGGYG